MPVEIELKYSLDDDLARRLLSQHSLAGFALTPFVTEEVTDIYFDTPDARVAQAGYALRFRRKGAKTSLQLKSLTPASGAWHQRRELHIATGHPAEPERWPDTPEARFLQELLSGQPLHPLFTLHQRRHEAQTLGETGKPFALLSLDDVRWQAGGKTKQAWELEIELLPEGKEMALRRLAAALRDLPGLHPQAASKYERGLAMLHQ